MSESPVSIEQIIREKRQQAVRIFKSSGPLTRDGAALREKAANVIVDALSTGAIHLLNHGVQDMVLAFRLIFEPFNDDVLLKAMRTLWPELRIQ